MEQKTVIVQIFITNLTKVSKTTIRFLTGMHKRLSWLVHQFAHLLLWHLLTVVVKTVWKWQGLHVEVGQDSNCLWKERAQKLPNMSFTVTERGKDWGWRGEGREEERRDTQSERARNGRRVSQEMMMEQYARAGQRRGSEKETDCAGRKPTKDWTKLRSKLKMRRGEWTRMRHAAQRPHAALWKTGLQRDGCTDWTESFRRGRWKTLLNHTHGHTHKASYQEGCH